jgi:hypothetical protein
VVFWLGFWFWWEHPGAELGRFFASLAVVGTWGDQPPSGVVGGGPRVTRRCPRRCVADLCGGAGAVFFFRGGTRRDKWLDRTGTWRARLGPAKIKICTPLRLEIQAYRSAHLKFESATWIPSAVEPACGATKSHLRLPPRAGSKK